MKFIIPATFDRQARRKDRGVSYAFSSNLEVSPTDLMASDKLLLSEGYLIFSQNPEEIEIPGEPAPSKEQKSKGQRMRAVYFLIWKKRGIEENFEAWYDRVWERWLDKVKEELE